MWALRGKRWTGYLSWRRRRRFVHRPEVLDALLAAVREERPDQVLLTGDLVHVGLPEEIEAAGQWLRALGDPSHVMLVPGNHDVYARDSWPAVARAWAPYLAAPRKGNVPFPVTRRLAAENGGAVELIGLSSAVPSPLFMASGELGSAQLGRLDEILGVSDAFRCVLLHHPPLPDMTSRRKGLRDARQLRDVLCDRGAELVLHGHVHRNVSRRGPADARVYGTASASSARDPRAAFRSFDVEADAHGWHVAMRLVVLESDGALRTAEEERWDVPVRPARAISASP